MHSLNIIKARKPTTTRKANLTHVQTRIQARHSDSTCQISCCATVMDDANSLTPMSGTRKMELRRREPKDQSPN